MLDNLLPSSATVGLSWIPSKNYPSLVHGYNNVIVQCWKIIMWLLIVFNKNKDKVSSDHVNQVKQNDAYLNVSPSFFAITHIILNY